MFLPIRTNVVPRRTPYVNYALILVNIVVFMLEFGIDSQSGQFVYRPWVQRFMLIPRISPWWTFVTYAFLHHDFWHILFNMFFLYLFGRNVNDRLGHWGYPVFYTMGAIAGGIALHGGLIPYTATFLVFSDYMRPPMRLAALGGARVIYVFTHDSVAVGEDGPTHQPIEQVMNLRAVPNLAVIRPADATETSEAWKAALRRTDGPTALSSHGRSCPCSTAPSMQLRITCGAARTYCGKHRRVCLM